MTSVDFNNNYILKWLLWFKSRYTNKISKTEILKEFNELLEPCHYNDTRNPDLAFIIEINGVKKKIYILIRL
jgi:hypothetical protein